MSVADQLRRNLANVRGRIAAACARAGRDPESVRLIAVTKYAPIEWVLPLVDLGVQDLGESRPQQLLERAPQIGGPVRWHLIGHLQRNKARKVMPLIEAIHSVDSLRLLRFIDTLAAELHVRPKIYLEVNVSGEASKDGFAPADLSAASDAVPAVPHVDLRGLMTMAPRADDPDAARQCFRRLRALRDDLATRLPESLSLSELSMGMSGDFETAIEEGATSVRIGSSLFEGLSP